MWPVPDSKHATPRKVVGPSRSRCPNNFPPSSRNRQSARSLPLNEDFRLKQAVFVTGSYPVTLICPLVTLSD